MSSVIPSATVNLSDTPSPQSAANPLVGATTQDTSTTNLTQDGAAQAINSATAKISDTLSAQSTTNPPAIATPTPGTTNSSKDGAAKVTSSTTSTTSPASSTTTSAIAQTKGATPATAISQDASTRITSSNTSSNSATAPVVGAASDPSGSPVPTPSSIIPSVTTSPSSLTTAPPTTDGPSSLGTDTQTPSNASLINAVSSPSPSPLAAANSGTSFFQNKATIIGIATAGGLLIAIFLIYVIARLMRSRRLRQLDREMDASFQETMNQAAAGWRRTSLDRGAGLQRAPSAFSTHSAASYGAYTEPPLAVAPQQPNYYNYGSAHPGEYAPATEYWTAGPPPMAMGAGAAQGRGGPQMMQPQRAQVYGAQTQTYAQAESGLVHRPSQSAAIQLHAEPQAAPRDYLSNYTSPPPPQDSVHSPVSPIPMPNPFDSKEEREQAYGGVAEQRVFKVTNE